MTPSYTHLHDKRHCCTIIRPLVYHLYHCSNLLLHGQLPVHYCYTDQDGAFFFKRTARLAKRRDGWGQQDPSGSGTVYNERQLALVPFND